MRADTIKTIAQEFLNIETLATQNSDSLDFHDCSVWGIKAALEAAYSAGRHAATKSVRERSPAEGTSFIAVIEASYDDLVEAFGEPNPGDGYKTEAEWVVLLPKSRVLTIYNYKTSKSYDSRNPDVTKVRQWSVGGRGSQITETCLAMLCGRAQLIG